MHVAALGLPEASYPASKTASNAAATCSSLPVSGRPCSSDIAAIQQGTEGATFSQGADAAAVGLQRQRSMADASLGTSIRHTKPQSSNLAGEPMSRARPASPRSKRRPVTTQEQVQSVAALAGSFRSRPRLQARIAAVTKAQTDTLASEFRNSRGRFRAVGAR
jgi:hypothetical protein